MVGRGGRRGLGGSGLSRCVMAGGRGRVSEWAKIRGRAVRAGARRRGDREAGGT